MTRRDPDPAWPDVGRAASPRPTGIPCDHRRTLSAADRIASLVDPGSFEEWNLDLRSDGLPGPGDEFHYRARLEAERERTGLVEAAVVGLGRIDGIALVVGATDHRFLRGSIGSAAGEKLTRAVEQATRRRLPLLMVPASGGARIHEGVFSLMQMAKIAAALARHRSCGGLYISIITTPTIGGAAGIAGLADFTLAEPGALVGFADARIHARVIGTPIPEGAQCSESLLEHGFVDRIVRREALRDEISLLLDYLLPAEGARGSGRRHSHLNLS